MLTESEQDIIRRWNDFYLRPRQGCRQGPRDPRVSSPCTTRRRGRQALVAPQVNPGSGSGRRGYTALAGRWTGAGMCTYSSALVGFAAARGRGGRISYSTGRW